MKRKLLLAALCVVGALGMRAQTDVTSTYITNPSFESDGAKSASNAALAITGWTQSDPGTQYNNTGCYDASTTLPTQGTVTVTPSAGDYFLYFRKGWSANTSYTFTSSETTLPAGAYTLSVDYKMVEGYDNTQNNKTTVTIGAVSGEISLGSATGTTKTNVSGGNAYTYLNTADWSTATANFVLEEAAENVQFVITLYVGGQRRSDFVLDNVKLLQSEFIDPTAISLSDISMIPTATKTLSVAYTPAEANHNTAITSWTSSNESVATVSSTGVVTAVAVGTSTITATAANGVNTTCTVTVEDPLANGDYYILNVATNKYLGGSNSWGTQASVIDHGIPFTIQLANGAYTLDSKTYNSDTQHYLNGTYVDGVATNIYITALGDGKYSLSTADGSAFLTANSGNTVVANTASDALSEFAQWKFVTKDELVAALASATTATSVDATFYIDDQNFSRNHWPAGRNTSSWEVTASNRNLKGGADANMCAETYRNGGGTIFQTLTVPNGKYGVKCQGFYRQDGGSDISYLYANDKKQALSVFNANGEGTEANMNGASASFSAGLYQSSELIVNVTDGSLTVGIEGQDGNWTCFDNFELNYYGPNLAEVAEELPTTDMTAAKWYYFDVAVEGEYDLTATTLSDIVYTTDGTTLVENQNTVTANFSGSEALQLTAGRYYVKSASAQVFAVAAHSFTYELGAATTSVADGKYTQSSTFTVTFPDAASNDPAAAAALVASSKATVNGTEVALTAVTGGFSLDLGTLTPATDYAIAIPTGVYGYEGQDMNAAITLTVHTPTIFDGTYFLYNDLTKSFLARGMNYGTRAVVDKYGVAARLVTNADGLSTLQFVDNDLYLGNTWWMYADSGTGNTFKIIASTVDGVSGYHFATQEVTTDLNAKQYVYVYTGNNSDDELCVAGNSADAVNAGNTSWAGTVWQVQTLAQRDAIIATYPTQNIANVITAAGLGDIAQAYMAEHPEITDIKAAATAYVAANYDAVDCTSFIGTAKFNGNAGDWTWAGVRNQDGQPAYGSNFAEVWNATGTYAQTISNLPAGIYKLTVQGYERRKDNNAATALYNAGYNLVSTYLAANGEQVRFTDWNEVAGKPTNTGGAVTAFNNGEAVNTVFVYLDGNTDLTITVKKPNYIWDNWAIFNNFTLTRYEQASAILAVNDEVKYGTFAAPFNVTVPAGVTAYTVTAGAESNEELTLTEVATIEANKPVLLYAENGYAATTVKGKTVAAEEVTNGLLTGVYVETDAPVGSYVLQYLNEKAAFYQVVAGIELPTVGANRAYLTLPTAGSKPRAIYFDAEGEATGIAAYDVLTSGQYDGIYTANGVQIPRLQKGLNVVKKGNKSYKIYVK